MGAALALALLASKASREPRRTLEMEVGDDFFGEGIPKMAGIKSNVAKMAKVAVGNSILKQGKMKEGATSRTFCCVEKKE